MSDLHLGMTPWAFDASGSSAALEPLIEQCVRAEELGYRSVWIPESHFASVGATPAPLLLLSAIAARTRELRLGTTSYLLPIRHALQIAEEVAVLDRLSCGRVILGVGRGIQPALFDAFNVPRSEKRERFEANLELMRRAWAGESVAAPESEEAITLSPLPVQRPHPPIWMAAFGPKAMAQVGRLSLPYLASPMESRNRLRENFDRIRKSSPDLTRLEALEVPLMRTVFIHESREVADRVRTGLVRQMRAISRLRRNEGEDNIDDVALIGSPGLVAEQVARYREEFGMTHLIARTRVPDASDEEIKGSIEQIPETCA